ncbi:MAG: CheR family methyltransferase, partial [Paludibacter sp.]
IKPELMENIDFSVFDLLDNTSSSPATSIFGDFDIVICSNLLFYFNPESRKLIIDKVTNSISNDGYLVTGEAERAILLNHSFTEIFPQSGIFQRKRRQT